MEWFSFFFAIMNFSNFWQNLQIFSYFLTFIVIIQVLESQGPENLIKGWIVSYWKIFSSLWIGFNFWISQIFPIFFVKIRIFQVFEFFSHFFLVFQLQGPAIWKKLLWGLLIGNCIVSSINGMVFNILMSRILAFFDKICNFFLNLPKAFVSFWYSSILKCENNTYSTFW